MKTIPLFYYPSTWVWVDDDKTLLSTMREIFSTKNHVLSFLSAPECLNYFKHYRSSLKEYSFVNHEFVDISAIINLRNNPKKYDEVTAMVIDYHMPEMNGFELARAIKELSIPKILLTGDPKDNESLQDDHQNLIHYFVQKGEADMLKKLNTYLQKLSIEYFRGITARLLSCLEQENKTALSDPTFIDFFETYCRLHNIREYYLIDKQGSFLCVDKEGIQSYLVIHTPRSIEDWLSIYGNEKRADVFELTAIKEHKKIPFFGISKTAKDLDPSVWPDYFYVSHVLEGRQNYFWVEIPFVASDFC